MKQGIKEIKDVLLYDLEMLRSCFNGLDGGRMNKTDMRNDFDYHFNLLKGNIKD